MRQMFAVLASKRVQYTPEEEASARSVGLGAFRYMGRKSPDQAFIVEAETAKKAENQVKRSDKGKDFDVLYAVKAEQLPLEVRVKMISRDDAPKEQVVRVEVVEK